MAEGGHLVKSDAFEMQTKCATLFKSVAFRLRGGTSIHFLEERMAKRKVAS